MNRTFESFPEFLCNPYFIRQFAIYKYLFNLYYKIIYQLKNIKVKHLCM